MHKFKSQETFISSFAQLTPGKTRYWNACEAETYSNINRTIHKYTQIREKRRKIQFLLDLIDSSIHFPDSE